MLHVPPAGLTARVNAAQLAAHLPVAFVTALRQTGAAFLCSKFFWPTIAHMTANTA